MSKLLETYEGTNIVKNKESVFLNGDEIGHIYEDENGWNSVPYAGDIGHGMIDSKEDAIEDVIRIWNEWNR